MKKLYPTAVLMATIGVGVQANELNITKTEVCGNGSLAASVEAVKSTDDNPWREARAELAASASGEVALEVADPSVKADFEHPAFQAWGTTFNELDLDALRMLTESERKEILDRAFLPDGELRFTRGRLTMNANDYSRAWYSCDEVDVRVCTKVYEKPQPETRCHSTNGGIAPCVMTQMDYGARLIGLI